METVAQIVSIPCGICAENIHMGDQFCPGCGRAVDDQDRATLQVRLEGSDHAAYDRGKVVRGAATWIAALAIVFAIGGVIQMFMTKMEAEKALARLSEFNDDTVLAPINGKTYTAGELRAKVEREPMEVLILNLALAGIMGGLWLWGKRAPLPAIACALAIFIVVHVVNALIDPVSIVRGIIFKILAIAILTKGLKSALAARAAVGRPIG